MQNKNTINILHLIESLACGGAERMLITTLAHLDREKFHSAVAYLYEDSYFLPEIEKLGIDIYPLRVKNIYRPAAALSGISHALKREKADIVHTNLFGADIYGRIAGKLAGVKCIVTTLHNLAYEAPGSFRNNFLFQRRRILDGLTGRLCNDAFVAVSGAVKRSSEELLGFKNVNLIHNSIDTGMLRPLSPEEKKDARKALGLKQDGVIIATAGRLDDQKGHMFLLEALADPKIKDSNVMLLVLGQGSSEARLKSAAETRGIEDRVIFLGYRKEVRQMIGCADIFVLPTLSEGFGLVLLEAMALKVPCIASRTGGISEIIEDGKDGLLVDPGVSVPLARAILELAGDPDGRDRIASNGYDKVVNDFDIRKNIKLLENLYEGKVN